MALTTTAPLPRLETRKPTGRVDWPIILLAGAPKTGKSYMCAEFAKSDLIGRLIWIPIGESDVDSFGQISDFELADKHDGTFRSILDTVLRAVAEPRAENGKPNAIVLDSGSILWELLSDEAELIARSRAAEKAAKYRRPGPGADDDVVVGHSLWNRAKDRWRLILNALRRHDGPVIICCRLEEVTEFDAQGNPTRNRTWKVKAERNLRYDATVVLQLRSYRRPTLTDVRSLLMHLAPDDERDRPGMTLDALMRELGMDRDIHTQSTTYTPMQPEAGLQEFARETEERVLANAAATEMRRYAAEGTLPPPHEVIEYIKQALAHQNDPRAALLMVRTAYTKSVLEKVVINTKRGEVNASTAIDNLLADLGLPPTGTAGSAPPPQRAPQEATPQEPRAGTPEPPSGPPASAAAEEAIPAPAPKPAPPENPQKPAPAAKKETPAQARQRKVTDAVRREADYQARVLSLGLHDYLADLMSSGALPDQVSTYELSEYVKAKRPDVVAALIRGKEFSTVEAYTKVGDGPCMNIDDVFADCKMITGTQAAA
ncbi:ATP-binding protein (plasmid) [Streptomyces sp. NBC_01278]|uniref:hypothetical protein n=1 Tax=Streptomyces sp. NBC_01278 TaxID=2903809 RepID=UPI002E353B7A|nr:hypothetical protein [Streptomyces sp. NBC_01278]